MSWLTAAVGFVVGLCSLAISGERWIPNRAIDPYWYKPCIQIAGFCLLGLTFVVASLVAVRDRRRGGLIFLVCAPVAAFCLGYPDAGVLVWEADGGNFYSPFFRTALGLTLLFFAPFVVPLLGFRSRKRALLLFLVSAAVVSPVLIMSRWSASLLPRLAAWSAPFVVFGLFWLGTNRLGWPPLAAAKASSRMKVRRFVLATCILVAVLDVGLTFAMTAWQSSLWGPDCSGRALFSEPAFPGHAVFTARLIYAGHKNTDRLGPHVGDWAVGVVQERFWGLPRWKPPLVLLTHAIFWEGETYFIDGRRPEGLLTRFLPIVEAGPCARTRPLVDATLEMRVLHREASTDGPRIVGFVRMPEDPGGWLKPPIAHTPFAGATIDVAGTSGTAIVTADAQGMYEVAGLPPDSYTLTLALPDTQSAPVGKVRKEDFLHSNLIERDFQVRWNGSIEGSVKDAAGGPAHTWLELQNPYGTDTIPRVAGLQRTDASGHFRIAQIPRGRYKLMVNPWGPQEDSQYPPVYYPSAEHLNDGQIFEIADGQHFKNVDFVVPRLAEWRMQVRVMWPGGQAADGAWVYVAYENTKGFSSPNDGSQVAVTDHDGLATFSVFGKSRIRIYAEDSVNDLKGPPFFSSRYSVPAEFEADKVPSKLDLVVTQKDLPSSPPQS